jgi:hypothetical protein
MRLVSPSLVTLAMTFALAACGGADDAARGDSPVAEPPANAPTTETRTELTEADVDAFQRGLAREIEAVEAAHARQNAATTPAERGAAIQASFEDATAVEGAKAAGMSAERYAEVRRTLVPVLRTLDFQGKIDGPMSLDTTNLSPERRSEAARDPLADLPPATANVITARLPQLGPLWSRYATLTAVGG